ncbi:MAG: CHASE3 domain-containing protein, partial [Acetobacteraceae bacterium]|nr:CHASE3 domain-containing protein [Acetobacteraceae bacterium]
MVELARPRSSPRLQAVLLGVALAALLAAGLVGSGAVSSSIDQLVAAASRARDQADVAEDILFVLQKAETGQRGFLLTGRPSYLEPYREATTEIGPLLARLGVLAQGSPWLQAPAAELRDLANRKLDELGRTVGLAQSGDLVGALSVVLTDAGRLDMESARVLVHRISVRAEAERDAGAAALRNRQRALSSASDAALVFGLAVLGVFGFSLIRSRAELLRARDGERLESERLQAAIEHVRDGVGVFDGAGRLALRNARFAPTLGLADDRVSPGTPLTAIAEAVPMDPPALDAARPEEGPVVAEVRQGGRVLEVWRSPMPLGGQMVAVTDITRRVETEAIARQAQKMEAVGQMTGGIAHDFNNLLQVISANVELSMERLARSGAEPEALERLEAASAGVARGARLTQHLLAFARRQTLAPTAVDPGRLLLSLEDMLRRTLGGGVELKLVIGTGLWAMRVDRTQLETALLNLTLNARDAMIGADDLAAGRVVIEVANVTFSEADAHTAEDLAPGDYVMFEMGDTGTGMTREQLARALEPFYTTKPEGKGTGLGLPMVFGFAKQSGGHFQLSSEPGRGTVARLYLPRTTEPVERGAPASADAQASEGESVLLVEDDADVRRVAAAAIRSLGYSVYEAGDGTDALGLLRTGLRPALLFTDLVMPGPISARELVQQARVLVPGLAVLLT